ncbi:MAG: Smr/MutS family protein [Planctomycetota bacterium]
MSSPDPPHALEIDLHGHTVDRAKRRLLQELTRARALRISPILVVTGKGHGSAGGSAKLRPAVEAWLRGPEGRALGVRTLREAGKGGAFSVELAR